MVIASSRFESRSQLTNHVYLEICRSQQRFPVLLSAYPSNERSTKQRPVRPDIPAIPHQIHISALFLNSALYLCEGS